MMNADQFWNIIEASRRRFNPLQASGNMEWQVEDLRRLLLELPPKQIIGFRDRFRERMNVAFRWGLWGAAYVIASGCSDDGLVYFRSCLISMGQSVFQEALANPESLAGVVDAPGVEDVFFEEFSYVPAEAYEEATGRELPAYTERVYLCPIGEKWSSAGDDLQVKFPILWARYRHSSQEVSVRWAACCGLEDGRVPCPAVIARREGARQGARGPAAQEESSERGGFQLPVMRQQLSSSHQGVRTGWEVGWRPGRSTGM